MKVAVKKHYENNKERHLEHVQKYQKEHVEEIREYNRNYNKTPLVKEKAKQYRNTHREQYQEYTKAYNQIPENKEKARLRKREWDRKHRLDPTHRLSNNIRTNMCHALRGKKGFRKWESLIGYTLQDLINHLQSKLTPDMTWDNYGSLWQVDHITPKSWFKYDTAEHPEFKKCWSLNNLQPKLATDNIRKGNRFIG